MAKKPKAAQRPSDVSKPDPHAGQRRIKRMTNNKLRLEWEAK